MARPGQRKKKAAHDAPSEFRIISTGEGEYAYLCGDGKSIHVKQDSDEFREFLETHDIEGWEL